MAGANPYIFGDAATDRQRLVVQTRIFGDYIQAHARRLLGPDIRRILDLGCGEGQLGLLLNEIYAPEARLVGIDKDERAIVQARTVAHERGSTTVEFLVGDVLAVIPPEPFDLAYLSFLLLHAPGPSQVLAATYGALRPGGYIWIKEASSDLTTAINHPSYRKLADLLLSTMTAIGAHPEIAGELPALLQGAGFVEMRQEIETHPLGGPTADGQASLASLLGVFHNARPMISKVSKVPESKIEQLYHDVCAAALHSDKEIGEATYVNIIARRPPN